MSINNVIRHSNFKRVEREYNNLKIQCAELERKLNALKADDNTEENAAKAEGFEILAEGLGIVNKVGTIQAVSEPIESLTEASVLTFDNKLNEKMLTIKSLKIQQKDDKLVAHATLAEEEPIFDETGAQVCKFQELDLGSATLEAPATLNKYGDLSEYTSVIEFALNVSDPDDKQATGLAIKENAYVKAYDTEPSFGDFVCGEFKFSVDVSPTKSGLVASILYASEEGDTKFIVAHPVPSKVEEEEEEQPEPPQP